MDLCPLCETPRPPGALECQVCGRIFHEAANAAAAAARLPELEPTSLTEADIPIPDDVVPGYEATSLADLARDPMAFEAVDTVPELESSTLPDAAAAASVAVQEMPDLQVTKAAPVGGPSGFMVICPGCGSTGQAEGAFCDRCGSHLSRPAADAGVVAALDLTELPSMCRACGARRFREGVCVDCGVHV